MQCESIIELKYAALVKQRYKVTIQGISVRRTSKVSDKLHNKLTDRVKVNAP